MKTKIALLTMIFLMAGIFATEVNAQQRGGQQGPGLQIGMLYADNMNLTDNQKAQIAELMVNRRAEMRDAREQMGRGARGEQRQARAESATNIQSAIREILTAEQLATYQANIQVAQENRQEAQTFIMMAQADAISDEAGLDANSKEKVQQIVIRHLEATKDFRANRGQAVRPDTDERIQRLEVRKDFEEQLQGAMSEEQYKTWMTEWTKMMPAMNGQDRRVQRGDGRKGQNR